MSCESGAGRIQELERERRRLEILLKLEEKRADDLVHSWYWRMTAPLRRLVRTVKARLAAHPGLWNRRKERLSDLLTISDMRRAREIESAAAFTSKVSILVPLYNTSVDYLREMLDSVLAQTYGKWELCLADASDAAHGDVGETARSYAARDARIRYRKLEANGGISENTNAALSLATGEIVALLDHDDMLHPSALFRVVDALSGSEADFAYTDEATFDAVTKRIVRKALKPDFDPDFLRGVNYICHFVAFRRSLLDEAGAFRKTFDGSQDHDLFLRLTEKARQVVHVPEVLYFWRSEAGSAAADVTAKPYAAEAGCRAVAESLSRRGLKGTVESVSAAYPTWYRVRYALCGEPKVSIVIPTRNHCRDLRRCLSSVFAKSTYRNYEVVVVDNGSDETALFDYYRELEQDPRVKVLHDDEPFNYSKINDFAVSEASGEYVVLLNNDTEVIASDWMEEMLMFAQRPDVGAVGARLLYADGTVQHAGVILGLGGIAGHAFVHRKRRDPGHQGRMLVPVECSAVTAACLMIRKDLFLQVGGLDPELAVAFNDIDLCLKVRQAGRRIIWTPYAELFHFESKSRGSDNEGPRRDRAWREGRLFMRRWAFELVDGDPFYNPAFRLKQPSYVEKSAGEKERS